MRNLLLILLLLVWRVGRADAAPVAPPPPLLDRLEALSATGVRLMWALSLDAAPGHPMVARVDGFRIYRDGTLRATLPASAREYVDSGLQSGTAYRYSMTALAGESESAPSAEMSQVTRLSNERDPDVAATYDVIVVGGTPGGIAAALEAARLGDRVALVCPSPWLGGMMTGGLGITDLLSRRGVGGLFQEYMQRILQYYSRTYGTDSPQVRTSLGGRLFEPHVATLVFSQMLAEQPRISILRDHEVRDVIMRGHRIVGVGVLDRPRQIHQRLMGQVIIDATYEGDVAAMAGAPYHLGREGRDEFHEAHAGEILWDPLKGAIVGGSGRGDGKMQAFSDRLCLTTRPDIVKPVPLPTDYDRTRYASIVEAIHSGRITGMENELSLQYVPNGKVDCNNHPRGDPSADPIGASNGYIEADAARRTQIEEAHRQYLLGLLYFLQNDPEVPDPFRREARQWGFAQDEFVDNYGFPTQFYVREGRRIMGPYVFTENDASSPDPSRRPALPGDSIAVADYPMDSHATGEAPNGLLEGFFFLGGAQTVPSMVPYRILTPLHVEGMLVCVSVSCTHVGYGTLRLEPIYMNMGEAAGTAAHLAVTLGCLPTQVPVARLQRALLEQHQVLCEFEDVSQSSSEWAALQWFGVLGCFPTYLAEPESPIDRQTASQWLRQAGETFELDSGRSPLLWREWRSALKRYVPGEPDDAPVTRGQFCRSLFEERVKGGE